MDMLDKLSNKIDIPGATLNCIVFHDGHSWRYVNLILNVMLCILCSVSSYAPRP